ncbi:Tetratricopeptide repeat domain protein (fragment) [Hyella patelloides LEGE 07179]|uniref:Tetratricopeptide repeat domain protein n=1 Tax=Hyella patelloides LEGE 07179 TaxID=945734 RepID=A0A563VVE3_9CYAN
MIERHGTPEQIINILTTTNDWLETHPENTNVRSQYLGLIERHGTPEQIINILTTTNDWLETHPEDTRVREKYLDLVQQCGTEKQKEKAIYVITDWLESHTKDNNIRVKYLSLVGRESKLVEDIQLIINTQWKWIEQKNKIEQCLWNAFLPVVHHHVKNNSQFIQQISQLALKQYPNNHTIACSIFYFQDYLEIETCYKLADFIADSDLPKRKWHSKVLVANFFREYEDLDKAEKIYLRTINNSRYCIDEFGYDLEDTYNFACLNYARLLIWKRPSQWKKAMDRYLEPLLKIKKTHSLAHLYLAQCHIEKIKNYKQTRSNVYNPIIHHFRQAIKYQEDSSENSKYEYEFGTFYWKIVENIMQARQHFNLSIGYRDNLPACVSLAELELEASNNNKAQKYIEQGLAIKMITRTEQEEKQKLMTQIINIKQQLEKNIN